MPTKEQVVLDIFNAETSEMIGRLENVTDLLVNSNSKDEYKNDPHGEWFSKNHWTATFEISFDADNPANNDLKKILGLQPKAPSRILLVRFTFALDVL
mgnify:CR=1 FL=1